MDICSEVMSVGSCAGMQQRWQGAGVRGFSWAGVQ